MTVDIKQAIGLLDMYWRGEETNDGLAYALADALIDIAKATATMRQQAAEIRSIWSKIGHDLYADIERAKVRGGKISAEPAAHPDAQGEAPMSVGIDLSTEPDETAVWIRNPTPEVLAYLRALAALKEDATTPEPEGPPARDYLIRSNEHREWFRKSGRPLQDCLPSQDAK